jgi:hypothetical protein
MQMTGYSQPSDALSLCGLSLVDRDRLAARESVGTLSIRRWPPRLRLPVGPSCLRKRTVYSHGATGFACLVARKCV